MVIFKFGLRVFFLSKSFMDREMIVGCQWRMCYYWS